MEEHSVQILFQIFVMFGAAKLFQVVGERARIPAVISEIVALSPRDFPWARCKPSDSFSGRRSLRG